MGLSVLAQAPKRMISGTVVDNEGEPLESVTVNIKGSQHATSTDLHGHYAIEVQSGDTLVFRLVGYQQKLQTVKTRNRIDVVMDNSDKMRLVEMIVTGYSTQERRDLTGSVSSVKLDEDVKFQTVDQMLQGKAPGVYMSTSSGALGGANVLTIRGVSSILGDTDPLYVIDGVPIYSTGRSDNMTDVSGGAVPAVSMGGTQTGGGSLEYNYNLKYNFEKNPLANLNPDDIESIEILKDAFATAIYGSRGANGVVLITTKKGRTDRTKVTLNYSLGVDQLMGKLKLLDGDDYSTIYQYYYPNSRFPSGINTDWVDAVTRTAVSNTVNAGVQGGKGSTTYYLSLSYTDNNSYIINQDMQRYNARLNLNTDIAKNLKMSLNFSLAKLDNNALQANDIYSAALKKAPNLPIYNPDGSYYFGYAPNARGNADCYNPVAMAYINDEYSEDMRVIGNAYIEWKPLDWLTWKTEVGTDMYNVFSSIRKGELPETLTDVVGNQASENTRLQNKYVVNNTLNINKIVGDHFIQGVLGQSYETSQERYNGVAGSDFFSPDLIGVGAAQSRRVTSAYTRKSALFSAFARMNYQYKSRYLAGLTYRLDGSSRYNKNHRYLSTPSASLGWRFSNEDFVKNNLKWINEGKLRGSVGLSSKDGNNSYYGAQATYSLNSLTTYGGLNYLTMSQPGNENLGWERTWTYNAGLDLDMLDSRIRVTLDWYYKKTNNMLFSSNLPLYTGYTKENQNIADMMNTGIDFQIVSTNIRKKDFMWQTILNLSRQRNKILKLNFEGNQLDEANSSYKYYEEGKAVAQWYLHKWGGVDPDTGNPLWIYKDGTTSTVPPASNDGLSQANKFVMGTALPTLYGSLTNSFEWKNWEMDFMFTYAVGCRMMNSTRASLLTYTEDANNLAAEVTDLWQYPGQITDIPKMRNNSIIGAYDYTTSITSTRFLENNSYLRLKNLTLAYRVPRKVLSPLKIFDQARIYVTMTNLLTLTKYTGLDPEVSAYGSSATAAGYDNGTMPSSRSYQFGVRLGF